MVSKRTTGCLIEHGISLLGGTMDSLAWSKTFPVFAISRLFLRNELGFTTEQVQRLTDDDLVRIADYVEQFYRGMSHFEEHVSFITTLVLSQVQPTEQEIQR